ncbi:hypothetical protein [Streptomyces sp. NPDC051180]|uniref:hypothetical protein n=1 Tax=unclassified Streptomyces TaxID=2593676 RepID=UPI00344F5BE9
MVRTRLKLAATLTVVVLALTGFHTGKSGHGSGGGSGKSKSGKSRSHSGSDDDSGGGCSSDEKSNDDYGGSGSGSTATASPSPSRAEAKVEVLDCVEPARKKRKGKPARSADTTATLRITSRAYDTTTFRVTLEFKGASGSAVDSAETVVTVGGGDTKTFEIAMRNPKAVDRVKNCWVYDVRQDATATPTASGAPSPSS